MPIAMTIETAETANTPDPTPVEGAHVPQPGSVEETGLELSSLVDLTLKTVHFAGRPSGRRLASQLALPFSVTDELVSFLRQEQMIEVVGSSGVGDQAYQYALTERGRKKVDEALSRSQYVGPAPVPFSLYTQVLQQQSVNNISIDHETYLSQLSHLVLPRSVLASLGPAVNSGRSVLIYGTPGNGKSSIASAIGKMLPGEILIPYAVEVHGQIVRVFDPRLHQRVTWGAATDRRQDEPESEAQGHERRRDRRWALAKRPMVTLGGELTLQDLELRYSPMSQFYIAPPQWKANGGLLVIDDLGRQMIKPQELLNRWIVPMEQSIDHLTLHTGDSVELPFDVLLVFASNVPPGRLGDEAFFRRIRHKVEIPNPTREDFLEILKRMCDQCDVAYNEDGAAHLIQTHYEHADRALRACHPRDIVELIGDIARFYGEEPQLSPDQVDLACSAYFVREEEEEGRAA